MREPPFVLSARDAFIVVLTRPQIRARSTGRPHRLPHDFGPLLQCVFIVRVSAGPLHHWRQLACCSRGFRLAAGGRSGCDGVHRAVVVEQGLAAGSSRARSFYGIFEYRFRLRLRLFFL